LTSSSFISAMNRLGSAASSRRPRFLRLSTLTASVARARVLGDADAARIETDGRSVIDIAREIVTLTGWCG